MSLRTYFYIPRPYGVDMFWTTEAHVHHHLICSTSERTRIIKEVQDMEPGQPFSVIILHRCLARYLTYSTVESDDNFLDRLTRIFVCELNKWNYQTSITLVSTIIGMTSKNDSCKPKFRTIIILSPTSPHHQSAHTSTTPSRTVLTITGQHPHRCIGTFYITP